MEDFDSDSFGQPPRSPIPTTTREPLVEEETIAVARGLALSSSIVGGAYALMAAFVVIVGGLSLLAQSGVGIVCSLAVLLLVGGGLRTLVGIVTAFTVAHSITLALATLDVVTLPTRLVEATIALSIAWVAIENIIFDTHHGRWRITFLFGLVHGFGFSFFLGDSLQFAGGHLAASLLAFNAGVELGQLLIVALAFPVLAWLFRKIPERAGVILLSALVAHSAWHWMTERAATLRQYRVDGPALDATLLPALLRLGILLLIVLAAGRLVLGLARRLGRMSGRADGQTSGQAAVPKAEVP